jgi:murein DD-endopeptidase MepM/ murein hydrolase activator NlpD
VLVSILALPRSVPQTDGFWKVPYEIELTNATDEPMTITLIEVRDPSRGDTLVTTIKNRDLEKNLFLPGRKSGVTLGPAQSGVLFVNLSFPSRQAIPHEVEHWLTVTAPPGGKVPERSLAKVARVPIDSTPPVVLGPPLRGERWVAEASCCASYHRRAVLPINGRRFLAQRFAIDWVQVDVQYRLADGDPAHNESYPQYGADVLAVADSVVVSVVDGMPEQRPGMLPVDTTVETADGNSVVLDLGDGRFALYAHLQPGSIRVRQGERLVRGQIFARLGNSGNSSAPHLHFHVMDTPSPLASNGLPYVIYTFELAGEAVSADDLDTELRSANQPVPVRLLQTPARHTEQLPGNLAIVSFTAP